MIDPTSPSSEPKSIAQRLARSLDYAWDWLTAPAATIQDRERRQQARLLSSLLLALILAITLIFMVRTIGGVLWQDFTALASVGAIATLIVIYRLSRTQHYIASATLTVAALLALIHTAPFWADRVDQGLFYATLPILLSSMLLSLPAMLGVAGVSMGNMLLLALISPGGTDLYISPLSHTLMTTAIIVAFIRHRDLIERHRQVVLRASESNYRLLLEQASDGIFITDQEGNYVMVNSKGRDMLGSSTGELLRLNIKDSILSADLTSTPLPFDELSAGKTVIAEWRLRGKNDRLIPVEVSIKRLDDGRLQVIARDIIERKRAEEALQAHLQEIETAYQQAILYARDLRMEVIKNRQAEEIRAELEQQLRQSQKIEAVGRLAGGVAHDFNNLLTAILGYAGMALEALPSAHPVRSDIQGIQKTAQRAADLVRQLLTFARQQVIAPRVLNLNDLILEVDTMLRRLIEENIELMLLLAPDLGPVKADPSQLEQLLVNLAVNARDAMPRGGKLIVETANVTFDQYDVRRYPKLSPGKYVMLAVSDTGIGMTEEVKARLFEPFFTTKEVGKGTGLGLAICFGIVEQSGGHIEVDSKPGQGTSFRIYLPRMEEVADLLSKGDVSDDLPWGT